ncbi:MAG: hypothetical protein Q8R43_00545 [Alphaproteobacteria bacterium]|nr:hypothetical protein [Alphaproteobacteria bacterium]
MYQKIIISTLFTTLLPWINLLSAANFTQNTPEEIYNSAFNYYTENRTTLTPRVLGRIEYQLKQIITDQNTSQEVLANTACLLFALDCTSSIQKRAMHFFTDLTLILSSTTLL